MSIISPEDIFTYDSNLSHNTNYALWYTMLCSERDNNNEPSMSVSEAKILFCDIYPE